jgi:hypothetical protein
MFYLSVAACGWNMKELKNVNVTVSSYLYELHATNVAAVAI